MKKLQSLPLAVVTKDEENDLLLTLTRCYAGILRRDTLAAALDAAEAGGIRGILLLADGYPEERTQVSEEDAARAAALGLRLYIEYPEENTTLGIGGFEGEEVMGYRRAVVTDSEALALLLHSILYVHGAKYLKKSDISRSLLVSATVAGYDKAVLGLEGSEPHVLLERNARGDVLVATTKLSGFLSARYAPYTRWQAVFTGILSWLSGVTATHFEWTPAVRPHFTPDEPLPKNAYREAVRLNSDWYLSSGILPVPDGSGGILEGFSSGNKFDVFGRQELRALLRADCNGESVGALALASRVTERKAYGEVAHRATRWLLFESLLSQGPRADLENPQYGLLSWHNGAYDQYYGDDNAKAIIGLLLAAAALETAEFDRRILEAILANFRTTGSLGFRGSMIPAKALEEHGWRHFHEAPAVNYSAHFEALPWACYLWAYDRTGYAPLLTRTKGAIAMMMKAYEATMSPEVTENAKQWRWTNGIQQERAKMILPLAWLVRLEPTEEHLTWLDLMVTDMMQHMDKKTGALADAFGNPGEGHGLYGPFTENAQYGRHESPVIQKNGDPCSDSLYTASFAMVTLLEARDAAEAAGEETLAERYGEYLDRLSAYHVRIQQVSERFPTYHGVWFRGFDFRKWETYGSDGDAGWGVFCIETGWSQAWISASLSLQELGTSVWDYTRSTTIGAHIASLVADMLDDEGDTK